MSHLAERRRLLTGAAAAVCTATLPMRLAAAPMRPPAARQSPVTDDYFGIRVTDPYRWMEDPRDPDWRPFLRGQDAYTRDLLGALPGREALGRRIEALSGDTATTSRVQAAGPRLFYQQRPAGADNFRLFVREDGRPDRVLIDPTALRSGPDHVSIDWWEPSLDGRHVVYGLSAAGSEESVLHVMNVDSGEILPERVPMTDEASPSWLPDGSGFFYKQLTGQRGTPTLYQDSVAKLHRLRDDPARDRAVMARGLDPAVALEPLEVPLVVANAQAGLALGIVADIRREFALYVAPLDTAIAGRPAWRRAFGFDALVSDMAVVGDAMYLLVNRGTPRGRVVRTSAAAPSLADAAIVMPQEPAVIEHLAEARNGVYVRLMDGGVHRMAHIARDDTVSAVALPFEGAVNGVFTSRGRDGAHVSLAGWLQPSGIWHIAADGAVRDTGLTPKPPLDLSPYETRGAFAVARDGVRVPYTVVARRGVVADGRHPTLVTAYGAYQFAATPRFSPALLAFLDAGGVFVNAGVRGGGEYGREWHEAGKKATKPNTWRDLIDVCETLVRDRLTSPQHLAIMGTSAGGITVGRAMTERPDLFAAVISNVGWSNPIRYMAEQNIADIGEWGPAVDAESFRIMLAMDSVHAVRDGVRYPAVLCMTGATDPRVAPWHVAKFAARLQAATASDAPVLLRVDFGAGHGVGSTRAQMDALLGDVYAFVLWRAGAAGTGGGSATR